MNIKLNDGTVRCSDHMDSAQYQGITEEPCLYCPAETVETVETVETAPEAVKAPAVRISPRQARETYWARRSPQYKGDLVNRWSRSVNGKRFEFVHIVWGTGVTTFVVYRGGSSEVLHSFAS